LIGTILISADCCPLRLEVVDFYEDAGISGSNGPGKAPGLEGTSISEPTNYNAYREM
jgi:hypothetical protein